MASQLKDEQRAQYVRAIFDTFPLPSFIVDKDVCIRDFNTAAEKYLGHEPALALHCRSGDALHCIHSQAHGCGKGRWCKQCVIRNSVTAAMSGKSTCREAQRLKLRTETGLVSLDLLVTASLLPYTDPPRALLVLEDVSELVNGLSVPSGDGSRRG